MPNLVETVKGYASHERTVFEKVTTARSAAMQASSPAEKAKAENILKGHIERSVCCCRGISGSEGKC